MKRRRFFVATLPASPGIVPLPPDVAHYATRVLRLHAGADVELFDGHGRVARGRLQQAAVEVDVLSEEPLVAGVKVAAPLLKGERQDWMIEKMCELGAEAYAPLLCERAQLEALSEPKRARLERVAQAAARQSGRAQGLSILSPVALFALPFSDAVILDPRATESLAAVWLSPPEWLLIGPEGGFTEGEVARLLAGGARSARLGRFVLRVETAVVAALAVAATFRDE